MKLKILIINLLLNLNLLSQELKYNSTISEIELHIQKLEQSLVKKDTATLSQLLHSDLTLGHSNGWIETKESLLNSLPTQKVIYTEFIPKNSIEFYLKNNDLVTLRRKVKVIGKYENETFSVDLNILEIWIKKLDHWQLLARQSMDEYSDD
ncbi:MAG: nuclear transport factor 2 family protein [Moheibacter sp.]